LVYFLLLIDVSLLNKAFAVNTTKKADFRNWM